MAYLFLICTVLFFPPTMRQGKPLHPTDSNKFTLFAEWMVIGEENKSLKAVSFYPNGSLIVFGKGRKTAMHYKIIEKKTDMITGEIMKDHPYYSAKKRALFKIKVLTSNSITLIVSDSAKTHQKYLNLKKVKDIEHGFILP